MWLKRLICVLVCLHQYETAPTNAFETSNIAEISNSQEDVEVANLDSLKAQPPTTPEILDVDVEQLDALEKAVFPETTTEAPTVEEIATPPPKQFYGAARLAFGQHLEVPAKTTTTQSSIKTPAPQSTPITTTYIQVEEQERLPQSVGTYIQVEEQEKSPENHAPNPADIVNEFDEARPAPKKRSKSFENLIKHSGSPYSAFDMAQYVFWTGDETGVAQAVEELIHEKMMSRESAAKFLGDISLGIEYLNNVYATKANEAGINSVLRSRLDVTPTIPTTQAPRNDLFLRVAKTSGADYDDMSGRLRLADFLFTEYTLEEVVYQLSKAMFSQSLRNGSEDNKLSRLITFLEAEGDSGKISPALQKKILDVILAALSNTLSQHPEFIEVARQQIGRTALSQLPTPSNLHKSVKL